MIDTQLLGVFFIAIGVVFAGISVYDFAIRKRNHV